MQINSLPACHILNIMGELLLLIFTCPHEENWNLDFNAIGCVISDFWAITRYTMPDIFLHPTC